MEVTRQFLEQGLLGAFLVGSLSVNFYLFKELNKSKQARIDDIKEVSQSTNGTIDRFRETLITLLTIVKGIENSNNREGGV